MLIRNINIFGDNIFDKTTKVTVYNGVPTDLIIRGGGKFGEDCIGKLSANNKWIQSISKKYKKLDKWTVGFWVYPTRLDGWNDMCAFYEPNGMEFWLYDGGYPVLYTYNNHTRGTGIKINANEWTYLQYTYENGISRSYVNGVFSTQLNIPTNAVSVLNIFQMESYYTFVGKISDLCVWYGVRPVEVPDHLCGILSKILYVDEYKKVYGMG
nr:MAG TPA: Concanavalin A-like lectin/glucanase superfamily protein [Caudoviricetes sp.]